MHRISRRVAFAFCLTLAAPAFAQIQALAQTITWDLPTEYPASAMPGEGVAAFAAGVAARSGGRLVIQPSFNAEKGIKSGEMVAAVREGKIAAADAFGGAMDKVSPVFGLSSLPFLAPSIDEARKLAAAARPLYEKTFAGFGLRLLYTTPWPPSGIWSKNALGDDGSLKGLTIRTYDGTSTNVMAAAGASAVNISFADVMPKLKDGSVLAVLSSGDGGAGRRLWEFLPHFAEVNYAVPLSFSFVSAAAYNGLPDDLRKAVDEAAAETEARQWAAIRGRLEANYVRMRENGVTISTSVAPGVTASLRAAAAPVVEAWAKDVGADGAGVLAAFRSK